MSEVIESLGFRIRAEIDAVEAWQEARRLAERHGFGTARAHDLATAVSELATNLVLHARRGGTLRLAVRREADQPVIEITAEDDGPGIADLGRALEDGYSTGGGLGCGLPGTRRLVDRFAISSAPGIGTRVACAVRRA
ncbi:putative anti-sigma regulatory factor, serine/threonine protein kinase [Methylobacterium sp. 4-46]|uniref:ATP-binding protein n=1 Tax=unclassified Methylobacterium TaxID=2615210 RepID=UPI000165CAFF|nr:MULTISPECIES: ATP-binding protein [Methylobacterium]ACA20820.1 putative anti-sigma regulatory factor, serine/threonine protein kinase [Methylobacterium sp. 4-46]WFT79975.1 ATP-binding protein [Methylobacterium nodulans]